MIQNVALLTRSDAQNVSTTERAAVQVAPTILQTGLPNGAVDAFYSQTLQISGSAPMSVSITEGDLPAGLALNGLVISGVPTKPVRAAFEVTATNSEGSDSKELEILVPNGGVGADAPRVTTVNLDPQSISLIQSQSDEAELTVLDQNDRPIVGIPVLVESLDASVATVTTSGPTDADGKVAISVTGMGGGDVDVIAEVDGVIANPINVSVIGAAVPVITTTTLPSATAGVAYTFALQALGEPAPSWSITSGALPPGLSMSAGGVISGTPTNAQTQAYTFVVQATNSYGVDQQGLSLTASVTMLPPQITTTSLPVAYRGEAYSVTLQAIGGAPITWSATGLPAGLSISPAGELSGVVQQLGSTTITVVATNPAGDGTMELLLTMEEPIGPARLVITSVHPDALAEPLVRGAVFFAPTAGNLIGEKIGEFRDRQFVSDGESATLSLLLSDFGGENLSPGDSPMVYIEGMDDATHIFQVEVI